jgi:hypothetical protein
MRPTARDSWEIWRSEGTGDLGVQMWVKGSEGGDEDGEAHSSSEMWTWPVTARISTSRGAGSMKVQIWQRSSG